MAASSFNDLEAPLAALDETELENKVTLIMLVKIELILFLSSMLTFCIVMKPLIKDYYKYPEKSIAFYTFTFGFLVSIPVFMVYCMCLVIEPPFKTKKLILFSKVHLCIVTLILLFSFLAAIDLMIQPQQKYVKNCASAGVVAIECLVLYRIVSVT
ncbi:hypothetical protein SUGI_1031980 [Cryptomeria japonica]|nr:hypothetical protein SUGI_1031980 [Cryptomeria japonica]